MSSHTTIGKAEIAFVRLTLPFVAGTICFYPLQQQQVIPFLSAIVSILFGLLHFARWYYLRHKLYRHKGSYGLAFFFLFFFLGGLATTLHKEKLKTDDQHNIKPEYFGVSIIDEPRLKNKILRCQVQINRSYHASGQTLRRSNGRLLLRIKWTDQSSSPLNYGDHLIIPAKAIPIQGPSNPATFDYQSWLAAQNIYHQIFINQDRFQKLSTRAGNPVLSYALELRRKQVDFFRKIIKNDNAFSVAATLILGYRADLDQEVLNIYSKTGTIHALSVSGMHVGLFYLVLNLILILLDRNPGLKVLKCLIILAAIWFYTILSGCSPAALRSGIMISAIILAKLIKRLPNSYNIVAFSIFLILVFDPYLIWDIGFQLSYLAVLGLIYLQPILQQFWIVKNWYLHQLWSALTLSMAAQLATYPLSTYYFHQFPLYFLLSNLFIILPIAMLMYLGIFILIFRIEILGPAFEWLINFTNTGLSIIANLPFSSINGIWINKSELVILTGFMLWVTFTINSKKKKHLFISLMLFLCLQAMLAYDKIQASRQRKTICFALKKDYAIALISGRTALMITNLKPDGHVYIQSVKPALDQCKIVKTTFKTANKTTIKPSDLKKIKASLIY
jgi:competence protein ComEC